MNVALSGGRNEGVLLLVVAALAQYGAARLVLHAQARPDGSDSGRRALGQWLPIAAVAIAATLMHQPEVAVSVILGTSVACLSLVAGLVTLLAPMDTLPPTRRVWPFLLPAALIPLMAGFSGHLGFWHALIMLAFGGLVGSLWHPASGAADVSASPAPRDSKNRSTMTLLAIALTAGGAYLAVAGTVSASNQPRPMSPGLVACIILSPLLILPTIGTASAVAQHGQVGRALGALVGTTLLNLGLLLPAVILIHGLPQVHLENQGILGLFSIPLPTMPPLPYPMAAWRIDNVLLVVLGFAVFPVASGRWLIDRAESLLLIFGYTVYLIAEAFIALR